MSWWITRIEEDKNGTRRVYHRNGGTYGAAGKKDAHRVTQAWTHPATPAARASCEVCAK